MSSGNFSGSPVDFTAVGSGSGGSSSYASAGLPPSAGEVNADGAMHNRSRGDSFVDRYQQHLHQEHLHQQHNNSGSGSFTNASSVDEFDHPAHQQRAVTGAHGVGNDFTAFNDYEDEFSNDNQNSPSLESSHQQHNAHQQQPPITTKVDSGSTHKHTLDATSATHPGTADTTSGANMPLGASSTDGSVSPAIVGGISDGTDTVNQLRVWEKEHEAELLEQREVEAKDRSKLRQQAAAELSTWKLQRAEDIRRSVEELRSAEKNAQQQKSHNSKHTAAADVAELRGPALWSAVCDMVDSIGCNASTGEQPATSSTTQQEQSGFSYMRELLASLKGDREEMKML
eukprot:Lankesteria_metandrocarpae@DN3874_c0_g1_i1.p1